MMQRGDGLPERTSAKERLLDAAATLLAESKGEPVSTRQITDMAGVKAPTLYHHFGDKEGLFYAVVNRGFERYLSNERALESSGDPVQDIRRHWDTHVRFGLDQPELYVVMFGNVRPERRPAIVADAEGFLEELLEVAAERGMLRVTPHEAARSILATNVGVTLMLIAEKAEKRNLALSSLTREAVFSAVLVEAAADPPEGAPGQPSYVMAAIALNASLQASHPEQLTGTEMKLFLEWLHRITLLA